jgi:hypothetical protein
VKLSDAAADDADKKLRRVNAAYGKEGMEKERRRKAQASAKAQAAFKKLQAAVLATGPVAAVARAPTPWLAVQASNRARLAAALWKAVSLGLAQLNPNFVAWSNAQEKVGAGVLAAVSEANAALGTHPWGIKRFVQLNPEFSPGRIAPAAEPGPHLAALSPGCVSCAVEHRGRGQQAAHQPSPAAAAATVRELTVLLDGHDDLLIMLATCLPDGCKLELAPSLPRFHVQLDAASPQNSLLPQARPEEAAARSAAVAGHLRTVAGVSHLSDVEDTGEVEQGTASAAAMVPPPAQKNSGGLVAGGGGGDCDNDARTA